MRKRRGSASRAPRGARRREKPCATSALVEANRRRGKGRASPRKSTALRFVDLEQVIKCRDIRPWHKQLRVDDQIDMGRRPFAAQLKLLNRPVAPGTCRVDAVDPNIGVNEYAGTSVVARETSGNHGASFGLNETSLPATASAAR